jgi:hypothetical protein
LANPDIASFLEIRFNDMLSTFLPLIYTFYLQYFRPIERSYRIIFWCSEPENSNARQGLSRRIIEVHGERILIE